MRSTRTPEAKIKIKIPTLHVHVLCALAHERFYLIKLEDQTTRKPRTWFSLHKPRNSRTKYPSPGVKTVKTVMDVL